MVVSLIYFFVMKSGLTLFWFCCLIWWVSAAPSAITKKIRITNNVLYPDLALKSPPGPARQQLKPSEDQLPPYFRKTKPSSMDGWLTQPKKAALVPDTPLASPLGNSVKDGFCGHRLNYGVQCGIPMNHCEADDDCPGVTKCCQVSDCGYLCVMPKDKEIHVEKTKRKTKGSDLNGLESATTAEGLKLEDIVVAASRSKNASHKLTARNEA